MTRTRAHRVPPAGTDRRDADYMTAFEIETVAADRSAECWARDVFEQAPWPLRVPVVLGWRYVLRLRLAPSTAPDQVAGWAITAITPTSIVLHTASALLTADKVVECDGHQLRASTYVRYDRRPWGRLLWSVVAPVHHRTEPRLLSSAVRRHERR